MYANEVETKEKLNKKLNKKLTTTCTSLLLTIIGWGKKGTNVYCIYLIFYAISEGNTCV